MTDPAEPRKTRVRFVNRVLPPAEGATGLYLANLADGLAARGWAVEIATGPAPGAPSDETLPSGVRVRRHAGTPLDRRSLVRRAAGTASLIPRLARLASKGPRPDVIVVATDPPLLFLAGPWLKRRTGAAVVHWAHDVYPEVAEALGVVPQPAARVLRTLARRALRRLDAVVAIGRCVSARLVAAGVPEERVVLIPNWAPEHVRSLTGTETPFRAAHGLSGHVVVMYSGTLGLAHPFGAVLDAAAELARTDPDVVFAVVGDGARRHAVEAEAHERGLSNVRFFPVQPAEALSDSLGAADLHLVTMDDRLEGLVVPSKVYGALASGRPVLFVGPAASEAAQLVSEHDAGCVLSHSGPQIAAAVRAWRDDPERRAAAGRRASQSVSGGLGQAVDAFDRLLKRVLGKSESECESGSE